MITPRILYCQDQDVVHLFFLRATSVEPTLSDNQKLTAWGIGRHYQERVELEMALKNKVEVFQIKLER